MNLTDKKYSGYALVEEMMDTIGVVRNFDPTQTKTIAPKIQSVGRLLMTGEGSSLPAPPVPASICLMHPSGRIVDVQYENSPKPYLRCGG